MFSSFFFIFLHIFSYFLHFSSYFLHFFIIYSYFFIFLHISSYFFIFLHISSIFSSLKQPTSLKKTPSTVVYEKEQEAKKTGEFNAFQGKGMRLDGKIAGNTANPAASHKETGEKKEEFDPRKHKLPNGVVFIGKK